MIILVITTNDFKREFIKFEEVKASKHIDIQENRID